MFRAERYGFMFTPSKLTAYLQAADAPFGIITTMQQLAQSYADDDYYLQKIMSNVVTDALLPSIMEKCIESLQSNPEKYGALIRKSWEQVGMFEWLLVQNGTLVFSLTLSKGSTRIMDVVFPRGTIRD